MGATWTAETHVSGLSLSRGGHQAIFDRREGAPLCDFPSFGQWRTLNVRPGPIFADGRAVFAVNPNDPRNIIAQPVDGGPPTPLTAFSDMTIEDFSLSPDGTRIAITRVARESNVVVVKRLK